MSDIPHFLRPAPLRRVEKLWAPPGPNLLAWFKEHMPQFFMHYQISQRAIALEEANRREMGLQ